MLAASGQRFGALRSMDSLSFVHGFVSSVGLVVAVTRTTLTKPTDTNVQKTQTQPWRAYKGFGGIRSSSEKMDKRL